MKYNKKIIDLFEKSYNKVKKENSERIGKNGLYEKDKIKWIEVKNLKKNIKIFRPFYKRIIYKLIRIYN